MVFTYTWMTVSKLVQISQNKTIAMTIHNDRVVDLSEVPAYA